MTISLQEPLWNRSLAYNMAECLRQGFIQKWPTYVEETIGDIYVWKLYVSVAAKSTRRGGWEEETLTREKEKVCKLLPPPTR